MSTFFEDDFTMNITDDDITSGTPKHGDKCAIAHAIWWHPPDTSIARGSASPDYIRFKVKGEDGIQEYVYETDKELRHWIREFDEYQSMDPITILFEARKRRASIL